MTLAMDEIIKKEEEKKKRRTENKMKRKIISV